VLEVEIKTKLPENCALGCLKAIINDCVLRIEGLVRKDDSIRGLIRIKAKKIEEQLSNLPLQCDVAITSERDAKILLKGHSCFVALPILESGCIITSVEIKENFVLWQIVCDYDDFLALIQKLEDAKVEFEIVYKGRPEGKDELTFREEEVLRFAFEKGYFDFPRKIRLEEIAAHFGIAASTISEIIRRGQKKILEKYFRETAC
jgi:predicted DNA binding protein